MSYEKLMERRKITEQWLREELRASRVLRQNTIQWGVTVIAAVELNLYYVRRDIVQNGGLKALMEPDAGLFGIPRWFVGTSFIALLCVIFSILVSRFMNRTRLYAKQLGTIQRNQHAYSLIAGDIGPYSRTHAGALGAAQHFFVRYAPYFIFLSILVADIGFYYLFRHAGEGPGISSQASDAVGAPPQSKSASTSVPVSTEPAGPKQGPPR
jgi:hypothetical protein